MTIVTPKRLSLGISKIHRELRHLGFLTQAIRNVRIKLTPFGTAYGYQHYGGSGEICIPCFSLAKVWDRLRGEYTPLRDILRHEFAHALADTHRSLFRSRLFTEAFGAPHNWKTRWEYHPDHHVSTYAATAPAEDFAETFMIYVRAGGVLPRKWRKTPIQRKWLFIKEIGMALRRGKRRLE
jgi:hypothetical protein